MPAIFRSPIWRFSVLLLMLSSLFARPLMAQGDDFTNNFPPFGSFNVSDFDVISLQNGNVHFKIPLVSVPHRKGSAQAFFLYDTPVWPLTYTDQSTRQYPRDGHYNVQYPTLIYQSSGFRLVDSATWLVSRGALTTVSCVGTSTYSHVYQSWQVYDPEGGIHGFPLVTLAPGQPTCPPPSIVNSGSAYDGSGLYLVYSPSTDTATLFFKDGTQVNPLTAQIEDPNGNQRVPNSDDLGRTLVTVTSGPTVTLTSPSGKQATHIQYTRYQVNDSNGNPQVYELDYELIDINTHFCAPYWPPPPAHGTTCTEITGGLLTVPSKLLLPGPNSSLSYQFSWFNDSGDLQQVILPSGGTISYTYGAVGAEGTVPGNQTRRWRVQTRTITQGSSSAAWTYNGGTVTDPLGNDEVHVITGLCSNTSTKTSVETELQFWSGSSTSGAGTLLRKVHTDYACEINGQYAINLRPIRKTTTLDNGLVSKTETDYETFTNAGGATFTRLNPTETREYNYGSGAPGALLRRTDYAYLHNSNSAYKTLNIVDRPTSVITHDGSGNTVAQTTYEYDVYNHTGLPAMAASGTVQHDSARNTNYLTRGNQTGISKWVNTTSTWLTTNNQFDDAGNIIATMDPRGYVTSFDYTDSWANSTCAPSGQGKAYPTTTTNAFNQLTKSTYNSCTGTRASSKDQNDINAGRSGTTFSYDYFGRLLQESNPDGGTTAITYNDIPPVSNTTTAFINSTPQSIITTKIFDALGRLIQSQLTSDPQGTVYTDTTYDPLGRVATVSNPYRSGSDITSSPGLTTYGYDALGRKTSETYPGTPTSALTTAYCGPSTLVTDPAGKWRRSRTDGLGRLVEVDEPNAVGVTVASTGCPGTGEPIWVTSYSYDALGNLTNVLQNGSHQRTFAYDSLARLTTSNNPEVGTITYKYDADTNCPGSNSFLGQLVSKVDGRGIRTCAQYDALNRQTSLNYSNGDTSVTTTYDQSACLGLSSCDNVGQRTSMTDGAGSEAWAYQVDRTNSRSVHVDRRTTTSGSNNITKTATYYLDLVGNVTQAVYPTGRTVNYNYDNANRPVKAVDASNGITYATGLTTSPGGTCLPNITCYAPQGSVYAVSIGQSSSFTAGLNITNVYNTRLQPSEFKASSTGGNAIDISYSFADPVTTKNAGHVYGITNNLDTSRTQTFTYDQLNRITSAQTASTHATSPTHCWAETYTLDAWANLQTIAQTNNSNYTGCSQESGFTTTPDGSNHIPAFAYDASGNATGDGIYTYGWNAESQLKSAAGVNYLYDGDGRRVSKSNGKLYWYGAGNEILAETDPSGNTLNEYVFFGGKRVAMLPTSGTAQFYVEDFLGSSRIVTNNTGVLCYDADFTPFGGERTYTNTSSNVYKFEGKERDTETQNDDFGARYYSWRFGRWLSADWSNVPVAVPYANLSNPQTLNLYSMVADDPESFADLDGHVCDGGEGSTTSPGCAMQDSQVYKDSQKTTEANKEAAETQDKAQNKEFHIDLDSGVHLDGYTNKTADTPGNLGMTMEVTPGNCNNCKWVQTVNSSTNQPTHTDYYPAVSSPHDPAPVLGSNSDKGQKTHWDSPSFPPTVASGSKYFVSTVGTVEGGKFHVLGSFTWGFSKSGGKVDVMKPRVSTPAEQRGSLSIINKQYPNVLAP